MQANIPTLPSGGGLPLDIFALIPGVQLLETFGVATKVTANILQFCLFVGTSPLSQAWLSVVSHWPPGYLGAGLGHLHLVPQCPRLVGTSAVEFVSNV